MDLQTYLQKHPERLKPRVTCYLLNKDRILLGKRLEGMGKGKYVGVGGKVEPRETLNEAIIREVEEEIKVRLTDFNEVAEMNYYFLDEPKWNQKIHVYLSTE